MLVAAPRGAPLMERCREAAIPFKELTISGGADVFGAWALSRLIRAERPDIVHAHDGHAVLPAKLALLFAGKIGRGAKLVAHRRTVFRINSRSKYSGRVDRVIAISQAAKETLLTAGVSGEKIRVVYSGMDFQKPLAADSAEANKFRDEFNIPLDAFVIAHAAALTSEKRQRDMLDALAPLEKAHLVIAGTGELENDLRAYAAALGIEKRVSFTGFLKDVGPLWAVSQIAFFASEAEGLCTALIEAQGAGLPAAVTRAGGMAEVVEDGATGVIFEIGNVKQMSSALIALQQDVQRCERLGRNAFVRARALFSARAMSDGVLSVYQELVNEAVK